MKPRYVAQVHFTEWTEDGRLRHPVFQGLRTDKRPEEVVRERHQHARDKARAPRAGRRAAPREREATTARPRAPRAAHGHEAHGPPVTDRRRPAQGASARRGRRRRCSRHGERVLYPEERAHQGGRVRVLPRGGAAAGARAARTGPSPCSSGPRASRRPASSATSCPARPTGCPRCACSTRTRRCDHVNVKDARRRCCGSPTSPRSRCTCGPATRRTLEQPDWVVFDLDPGKGGWEDLISVATRAARAAGGAGAGELPEDLRQARAARVRPAGARAHLRADAVRSRTAMASELARGAARHRHHRALHHQARRAALPGRGPERAGQDGGGALLAARGGGRPVLRAAEVERGDPALDPGAST